MRSNIQKSILSFVFSWVLLSPVAFASMDLASSLVPKIRRELVTLSYYIMFDNLSFRIDGSKVTLSGEVWWSTQGGSCGRSLP